MEGGGTAALGPQQVRRGLLSTDRPSRALASRPRPPAMPQAQSRLQCDPGVHTSADRQLPATQAPLERQVPWQPPGSRETGLWSEVSGRPGNGGCRETRPRLAQLLQPNPVWERDSAQLTSQVAPFSGVSEPAHGWGRLAAAFSQQQKGHLRKHSHQGCSWPSQAAGWARDGGG